MGTEDFDDLQRRLKDKIRELDELKDRAKKVAGRTNDDRYEAHREAARKRQAKIAAAGRDIGPIPPIKDTARREEGRQSLARFCRNYNPSAFFWEWGNAHRRAIQRIEEAVTNGGLFAFAMPRGSGKTTLCRMAILWAVSYAWSKYAFLIGSTANKAEESLEAIKTWITGLPQYREDFPEIAIPIGAIAGIAQRQGGQLCCGQPTLIRWEKSRVVLPHVPPPPNLDWDGEWAPTAGVLIGVSGLTGSEIRGSVYALPDGRQVRPDLVLLDDPQTDESAKSQEQNAARELLVSGAVLGMGPPDKKIAAIMPCTVIRPGDMVDRMLNRKLHPSWRGERSKMLDSMPVNMDAWDEYFKVYVQGLQSSPPDMDPANHYYLKRRQLLDEGASASWPERKNKDEISAVQHAMHLYFRSPAAFYAEFQNEPMLGDEGAGALTTDEVANKLDGRKPLEIPIDAEYLTAMIDVHDDLLYYAVMAWAGDMTGWVIDYGSEPDQKRFYYRLRDATRTLRMEAPGNAKTKQAAILAGIARLAGRLLNREWKRADGAPISIGRMMVDAGYVPTAVHDAIRAIGSMGLVVPSRGQGITAAKKPIAEWTYARGDRRGHYWGLFLRKGHSMRTVEFDANYWKSRVRDGFRAALGDPGSISLWGREPEKHRMFADHLSSEAPEEKVGGGGNKVEEWKLLPTASENHLFDAVVGCMVAASTLGAVPGGVGLRVRPAAPKPRQSLSELQRQKWQQLGIQGRRTQA